MLINEYPLLAVIGHMGVAEQFGVHAGEEAEALRSKKTPGSFLKNWQGGGFIFQQNLIRSTQQLCHNWMADLRIFLAGAQLVLNLWLPCG